MISLDRAGLASSRTGSSSGQQALQDLSVDVGESVVPSLKSVGESLVVDAQQVKNGRMEIMYVNAVFGDVV